MPFCDPFNSYYKEILVPAINNAKVKHSRADEVYGVRPIIEDIAKEIIESDVIIADVTGKNPNVNYELGMAHALGKQVVIISKNIEDVPFDYRHVRAIVYNTDDVHWSEELSKRITETILTVISDKKSHFVLQEILASRKHHAAASDWGLHNIYETRQEMNIRCNELYDDLHSRLDICAFGLKSFRDAKNTIIRKKVKNGLKIRILSPNPKSPYIEQREKDEDVASGDIGKQITALRRWVNKLQKDAPEPHSVEHRYYNSLPLDFYWHQQNNIFIGPYMQNKGSQQTITYEFLAGGKGYDYYQTYFDDLWDDDEFCS